MATKPKKFRMINAHFRGKVVEFEMEGNLHKWEGNSRMFKKLLKSIKQRFKLKTAFAVYDPNDDMFVDDIDDLCGCYIGYESKYDFILNLNIKADAEPVTDDTTPSPTPTSSASPIPPSRKKKKKSSTRIKKKRSNIREISSPKSPSNSPNTPNTSNHTKPPSSPSPPPPSPLENLSTLQLKPMSEIRAELSVSRRKSHRLSVDFGLFTSDTTCILNTVWLDFGASRIKHCDMLTRLIHALRFYMTLDVISHDVDKDEFNHFFDDIYTNMLDDYIHIMTYHTCDLAEIHKSLQSRYHFTHTCGDAEQCTYSQRHLSSQVEPLDDDPWINFYIQTYDSLHFVLFHLHATGLRSGSQVLQRHTWKPVECYDSQFKVMVEGVSAAAKKTSSYERYKMSERYTLPHTLQNGLLCDKEEGERLTFTDSLMVELQRKKSKRVAELYEFVVDEEYDSEAMVYDMEKAESNIDEVVNGDVQCLNAARDYIKNTNMLSASFRVGLVFYYWPYYKQDTTVTATADDSCAFSPSQLYVEMKHATFKQEILNYGCVSKWQYSNLVVLKAKQYLQTRMAKSIHLKFNPHLHFEVDSSILTRENLIALVLYTDFDVLAKEFASTFRQIRANESLQSIKRRNQTYWWLSKTLREVVQYFGDNGSPSGQNEKGPFYCAMSRIVHLPECNACLCGPVSTSTHIEVVTRFNYTHDNGMIVQLNNSGDYENARYLRSLNLSWISKHKEEDERLFMGGDYMIRVETIKMLRTNYNYVKYFEALFLFDCVVNGRDLDTSYVSNSSPPATPPPSTANNPASPSAVACTTPIKTLSHDTATPKGSATPVSHKTQQKVRNGGTERAQTPRSRDTEPLRPAGSANAPSKTAEDRLSDDEAVVEGEDDDDAKNEEESKNVKSVNYHIIKALIDNKIGVKKLSFPMYMIDTFNKFCRRKKVITLNMFYLDRNLKEYSDLLMNEIEMDREDSFVNPYSFKNTLKSALFFELFDSVKTLVIYSTNFEGLPSYSFSLMSLLSSVEFTSTFKQIIIKAARVCEKKDKRSWLYQMYNTSPLGTVKALLKENSCHIFLKQHTNNLQQVEDWLVIERE